MSWLGQVALASFLALSPACVGELAWSRGDEEVDEGTAPDLADDTVLMAGGTMAEVVNTEGRLLLLRAGPGVEHTGVDEMAPGTLVRVVSGPEGNWYELDYDGQSGWAHGHYLAAHRPDLDELADREHLLPWTFGEGFRVTQGHNGGSHTGYGRWAWDFSMPTGSPIRAVHGGVVRLMKRGSTSGGCSSGLAELANYVVLDRGDGIESLYLHLSTVDVDVGDRVRRGDVIGKSGATGWACGPHLHFQVQLAPSNGGGPRWYNPSVLEHFTDTGDELDPRVGMTPVSANQGPIAAPAPTPDGHATSGSSLELAAPDAMSSPHGDAGASWDEVHRLISR